MVLSCVTLQCVVVGCALDCASLWVVVRCSASNGASLVRRESFRQITLFRCDAQISPPGFHVRLPSQLTEGEAGGNVGISNDERKLADFCGTAERLCSADGADCVIERNVVDFRSPS